MSKSDINMNSNISYQILLRPNVVSYGIHRCFSFYLHPKGNAYFKRKCIRSYVLL